MIKEFSLVGLISAWVIVKKWLNEISKIAKPLCVEAEKLALDGKIDKADRKALVLKGISLLEENGKLKLNFISRIIVSKVIDKVAEKLPDFTITKEASELLKKTA